MGVVIDSIVELDLSLLFADFLMQEVGFAHMRIADGVGSLLQLTGLLAKLCKARNKAVV
jgi:hypothetical protein